MISRAPSEVLVICPTGKPAMPTGNPPLIFLDGPGPSTMPASSRIMITEAPRSGAALAGRIVEKGRSRTA